MKLKLFLYRTRREYSVTKEELQKFEDNINKFDEKNNIKAGHITLVPAFNHLNLLGVMWYNKEGKNIPSETIAPSAYTVTAKKSAGKGRSSLPVYNSVNLGKEIGALWHWKRDGTMRGDLRDEKIDIDFNFFEENREELIDKQKNKFYVLEFEGERLLIFPVKEKENYKQPDYRIYEG